MTDRFKILLDQLMCSPSEFADRIGVQRSSISHILSGRNKPSIDFLEKILIVYPDIDINWLITGKKSLSRTPDQAKSMPVNETFININDDVKEEMIKKRPVRDFPEPVDQIIVVYKDNTFRILNPADH